MPAICLKKNKRAPGLRRGPAFAFTLVEALVVLTIFVIISIGISGAFVSGVKIWNRAKNTDISKAMFLLNMEAVARELRQSIDAGMIGFEGNAHKVSFPAPVKNSVMKITYEFDAENNALVRAQVALADLIAGKGEEEQSITTSNALTQVEEISFSYFGRRDAVYGWAQTWQKDKGAFTAIRLQGKFNGEEFVKTVFIPVS